MDPVVGIPQGSELTFKQDAFIPVERIAQCLAHVRDIRFQEVGERLEFRENGLGAYGSLPIQLLDEDVL